MRVNLADLFAQSTITAWDAVVAVLVAAAGWIASSLAKKATLGVMHRIQGLGEAAATLVARIVRYSLLLLTLGIVLTVLGAPLQPILAAVIVVVAVCALALRGIASNFGAGIVIQARHTVRVGDEIEVLGFAGVVTELNGRAVVLHAPDGRAVHLPNSALLESPVVHGSERGLRRSEIELRARTALPLAEVRRICVQAVQSTDRVRAVPQVQALVSAHSPEAVTLRVRFWHDWNHRAEIRSAALCSLVDAFAAAEVPVVLSWRVPAMPLSPAPPF